MSHDPETLAPPPPAPALTVTRPRPRDGVTLEPFHWRPVIAIACSLALTLLATSSMYDYSGDQLYFLSAGKQLASGYVDQSFLVPDLARTLAWLVPGNPMVLRVPAAVVSSATVVFCALLAQEMGGRRRAQMVSAAAAALSPVIVIFCHLMITPVQDIFHWTLISWMLARWIRLRADRLLIWVGLLSALALQNKFLVGVYLLSLVVAIAVTGPRQLLRRPALWVAGAIALGSATPYLLSYVRHGGAHSPAVSVVGSEDNLFSGSLLMILPLMAMLIGFPLMMLLVGGLVRLLGMAEMRTYRFFGWAALCTMLFFLGAPGRTYYIAALFPVLWAAGAVSLQYRRPARVRDLSFSRSAFVAYYALRPDGRG